MRSSATCSAPSRGLWTNSVDQSREEWDQCCCFGRNTRFFVLIYAVLALLGDMGVVFGGILCAGALFAALFCVTLRLIRIEEKLNTLASKTEKPESDRASNHIGE